jgi:C-terminal processing protease CtpA/Prc
VRGNGGGLRTPLRELFPYFMFGETPVVASLALYRLWEGFNHDHLVARYMYRFEDERWRDEERNVIREFRKTFEPSVEFPKDKFSDWHYFVLSGATNPNAYCYAKPVVVLMDSGCFSATDIFLGSLKGKKNVTLIGQASSGGSGFAVRYDLPNSGLSCQVASMLSFQPNGQLYDTLGIQPDIEILPKLEDFVSENDAVLTKAIEHIKNQA